MRLFQRPIPLSAEPDCDEVDAVLQAYLDGEIGPEDAEVVGAHLAHCERCGVEAATVQQVIEVIQRQRPDLDAEPLRRLAGFVDELTGNAAAPGD